MNDQQPKKLRFHLLFRLLIPLFLSLSACDHRDPESTSPRTVGEEQPAGPEIRPVLDLPLEGCWIPESYINGRSLFDVAYDPDQGLDISVKFDPDDPDLRQGEVFCELETLPSIRGHTDFTGAVISARWDIAREMITFPRYGTQIFLESENGDGKIARQYGPWTEVVTPGQTVRLEPTMFPDFQYYSNPGLDVERGVAVGLKIALNSEASRAYAGKVGLKSVTIEWPDQHRQAAVKGKVEQKQPYLAEERARFDGFEPRNGLPFQPLPPATGRVLGIDDRLRALANVEGVETRSDAYGGVGIWIAQVRFGAYVDTGAGRSARVAYSFETPMDMSTVKVSAWFAVDEYLRGVLSRPNRVYLELVDADGHMMRGPWTNASARAYQWQRLELVPTVDVPMPLGSVQARFDMRKVRAVRLRFELGRFSNEIRKIQYGRPFEVVGNWYISPISIEPSSHRVEKVTKAPLPECATAPRATPREEFIVGINYPWIHYGWDIGKTPYGGRRSCGFSWHEMRLDVDFAALREAGVDLVRVFLLGDLRTGVILDDAGAVSGLDECVGSDLASLIDAAKKHEISVMPVLIDFLAADGVKDRELGPGEDMVWLEGEHPELLVDARKRRSLLDNAIRPLVRAVAQLQEQYGNIHSIDIANEIGNAKAVVKPDQFDQIKEFVRACARVIETEAPGIPATLGTRDRSDLVRYWRDIDLGLRQFHFYDDFGEEGLVLDYPAACLGFEEDVLAGEVDPTGDVAAKVETIRRNGYRGVLFWSLHERDGFRIDLDAIKEWKGRAH